MHAIGIDVGSTNLKAVLVDAAGTIVGSAARPLRTTTQGERVGQDADELWDRLCDALRELTATHPDAAADVVTIGTCSQYSSLVPVGAEGRALAPIKMYLDTRGADRCWEIHERHPDAFATWVDHHGIPPVGEGLTLGHLLHFQLDEPRLHDACAAYLEVMDLVTFRLTGRITATEATMFASQLCETRVAPDRTTDEDHYDPLLVELSGVDASRLPPLVPVDAAVGPLLGDVAAALGLPDGVVVRAGMNDTQAGALATGALEDDSVCGLAIGTTAVLIQSMRGSGADLDHEVFSMPVAAPGRRVVMAENGVAGRSVERALEVLSPAGSDPDTWFDELAGALQRTPPGAGGLLFLPWLGGSMSPSSASGMRGGYLGMTLQTSRDEVLRATVEGVARNLRWLLPAVEQLSGHEARRLVFAGGGARVAGLAQVVADVTGRPVDVLDRPELAVARAVAGHALACTAGGSLALAAVGPDVARIARTVEPDPSAREVHDRLQPLFEAAFEANRAICEALGHE